MGDISYNIVTQFTEAAAAFPEETALIHDGASISYRQLADEVERTAARFRKKGIDKGDKILVFVPMSIPLYRTVLALFRLGACPVFLDEWVSLERLKACLQTVPCKGMIAGMKHRFIAWFIPALRKIPVRISPAAGPDNDESVPVAPADAGDTALVTFTTGSTGIPKAADRTHAFLQAQLDALDPLLAGISSPCLTTLPIVVLLHLARGRTTLLPPSKFKAAKPESISRLYDSLVSRRPKSLIMSPAIIETLLDRLAAQGTATDFVSSVLTGGGPVYPDLAARLVQAFPRAKITAVYGSTEAEPISHIDAAPLARTDLDFFLRNGLPVGKPDPATTVRILRPDVHSSDIRSEAQLLRNLAVDGGPGEIIVAGAHVLGHYINNPAAEAEIKIRTKNELWHRSGDCGRIGPDGRLYLLGRVSEIIQWNGRTLFPTVLCYFLRVDAGIPVSALLQENQSLILVLEERSRPLADAAVAVLGGYGISGLHVAFVNSIPRDPRHRTKVDYAALQRIVSLRR